MIIKNQVQQVLEKYPSLNYFGFGLYDEIRRRQKGELNQAQYDEKLKELQQELFNNIEEVEYVVSWLRDVEKIKAFNSYSSYGLKHLAEKTAPKNYISNGSFIVGAILAGFSVKVSPPNAYFNMSERSLKKKETMYWKKLVSK